MATEHLPEHLKSRRTAEAVMAPSAIVAGGAGAAAAILAGAALPAVVLVGAVVYGAVVALRLPRRRRRHEAIEPRTLTEPWSRFVEEALDARRRFAAVVHTASAGPVRDRLAEIGERVEAAVQECWRIARRGAALDRGVASLELAQVRAELDAVRDSAASSPSAVESRDHTIEALEAQVASGERLARVAGEARDRLRLLDARLDESVARAVELSLQADDVGALSGLGADVEQLVGDMEALRQGLEEAAAAH